MRAYLTALGRDLLLQANSKVIGPARLTGMQIGSRFAFTPTSAMMQAEGQILLDARNDPSKVHVTPRHLHEMILTARVPRNLEFPEMGHVLFFINNAPLLWAISNRAMPKQKTNGIAHFAGDEYFFPVIFRFPFIKRIIDLSLNTSLAAKFPSFPKVAAIPVPEHAAAEQIHLDTGPLHLRERPVTVVRTHEHGWMANPSGFAFSDGGYGINGGKTRAGV